MSLLSQKCQKWQNIVFEQKPNCPQVTSGPQFFFWVASCLCQGLKLASEILGPHTEGGNGSKFCIDHQQKVTRPRISIIVQDPNGALCWPPSPSASPLSSFSSLFGRTTRPSMQISQVCVLRLVRLSTCAIIVQATTLTTPHRSTQHLLRPDFGLDGEFVHLLCFHFLVPMSTSKSFN